MQPPKSKENLANMFSSKRNSESDSKRGLVERKVPRSQNASPSQLKAQRPATGTTKQNNFN